MVERLFRRLQGTVDEHGMRCRLDLMFNADETAIRVENSGTEKVLVRLKSPSASCIASDGVNIQHLSYMACVRADGARQQGMFIVTSERKPTTHDEMQRAAPGETVQWSKSGFMNEELFIYWLEKVFNPQTFSFYQFALASKQAPWNAASVSSRTFRLRRSIDHPLICL